MSRYKPTPGFVLFVVCVLLGWFTFSVFWVLGNYENEIEYSKGWEPREIPICDRELWERIKDGC
jgi:hypothetical protein